ncbi:nuclear transport factor 2 family protein [Sphingomonas sp. HF-S3]|uniref:Nuclear transport factor 2 family protein n=1 Tax=Sphingomonas rustica TaxID=3103142 RepID=A0ABV0BE61_9SPHN
MTAPADTATDLAIRLRRAAFNRALAERDLSAIQPILAPDAVLVAGTDSALLSGRKAQLLAWKREFAAPDPTTYTRTPDRIEPSPAGPMAMEHGHWQGVTAASGTMLAHGSYAAKWRKVGADWVIEAEIYLTLG